MTLKSFYCAAMTLFSLLILACYQSALSAPTELIDMNREVLDKIGSLEFRECLVSSGKRDRKVQCAWYEVPENYDHKSQMIKLFIVRLPAKREAKKYQDPMLFIAGGPGQSASQSYLFSDHVWTKLAGKRDFYLIDQRGTGHSSFKGCYESDEMIADQLNFDKDETRRYTIRCLESLQGNLRLYNTDNTVKDFERVREALGVEQWNLYGVSYGTRVSTHYMRFYPKSIRSVVLDSVIAPQEILGSEIAYRSQKMLDTLIQRCTNKPDCDAKLPGLKEKVNSLFKTLANSPVKIQVENFSTGKIETMLFTKGHLSTVVRFFLYTPHQMALLPTMLYEAAENKNFAPLARTSRSILKSLARSLSTGLHNTVMCTEEYPYLAGLHEDQKELNRSTYLGMHMLSYISEVCKIWPKGKVIASAKDPLISDIPTLLLSGEFDPITPQEYAEKIKKTLSNSRHISLKGQGHFVGHLGCTPHLIEDFISKLNFSQLRTKCLNRIDAPPIFTNFNSSSP